MAAASTRKVLPGFGLSLGFTLAYLSLIVLIPLAAVFLKTATLTFDAFWQAVASPRVVASYRLTFGASLLAAVINTVFGLMLAWSMPALTSTVIWQWIFDTQYGIANWVLGRQGQSWLSNPLTFYFVATIIVVWMGIPFVAFTLYAGLTQIPEERMEAAAIDGAGAWQRFRDIVVPALKPILLILTSLSVLWDFRVFTQVYVLQRAGGITRDTNVLGVYAYRISIGANQFDKGAAVAIVMVGITLLVTVFYLRSMTRQEEL